MTRAASPSRELPASQLLPRPSRLRAGEGAFAVAEGVGFAFRRQDDARAAAALERLLERWERQIGRAFARDSKGRLARAGLRGARLVIECGGPSECSPQLGQDESYRLRVGARRVELVAPTTSGLLCGLATLEQLLVCHAGSWVIPALRIDDRPRFPWRGLLIDVCRHWQPVAAVKRQIDAMALVKLNVLHLHLSEDQGFRAESRRYPRLHECGSDGHYYTQDDLRELVAYAADRGVRVVPEFDVPGHVTSWLLGYPELAAGRAPTTLRRNWGVSEEAMDPTNEAVYELLDGLIGEMAAIFPDRYFHIGGDEVKAARWSADARIQRFIRDHSLGDNRGLQAYFNRRVRAILAHHGKEMIGWDEVLHPELPASTVIQSWRGPQGLHDATKLGRAALLSNGYYLDLNWSAHRHYAVDPIPADTTLTPAQQALVLGGEAAMWTEWVDETKLDGTIWPRAAAIAERLWSPREACDETGLSDRLAAISGRLEGLGLRHESAREARLREFAGPVGHPVALSVLADWFEPVKNYGRNQAEPNATQFRPLTGFADCLRIESEQARSFEQKVVGWLNTSGSARKQRRVLEEELDALDRAAAVLQQDKEWALMRPEAAQAARIARDAVRLAREILARAQSDVSAARRRGWRQTCGELAAQQGHFEWAAGGAWLLLALAVGAPRPRGKRARRTWCESLRAQARVGAEPGNPAYEQWL